MQPTNCVLLPLTTLPGAWIALSLRARYRDRLIRLAGPFMEQGEHRTQWRRSSRCMDWLLQPVRRLRLLKATTLPVELHDLRRRFTAMTYIAAALVALMAHRTC